jgi:hypothetical protein
MPNNITIDTNVFVHLFNPFQNRNGHIDDLLQGLVRQSRVTCYDVGEGKPDRIESEYLHQLGPIIKSGKTERIRIELFRYFFVISKKCYVQLNFASMLGVAIRRAMTPVGAEPSDHAFAYVACWADSPLITNNTVHFPRNTLCACARRHGSHTTDFYTTQNAIGALLA